MELDPVLRRKIVVSVALTAAFVAAVVVIGVRNAGGDVLDRTSGFLLVGAVTLFVVAMAAAGLASG